MHKNSTNSENTAQELVLLTESVFDTPDPFKALLEPEGLSAVGGDLKPERLIHLYQHGFFPWYSDPDPILWWHPIERCTLKPKQFHLSRSLRKCIKNGDWTWRVNDNFLKTIKTCSKLRVQKEGTWISDEIIEAYSNLNRIGYAFSIEVFQNQELAGGFYGIAMGKMFFGESMFSLRPNGSKVALWQFCQMANKLGIELIDCQVESDHLISLGAKMMSKKSFVANLQSYVPTPTRNAPLNQLALAKCTHQVEFKAD
ncbi:leucyl/phenylalanyl-tRNA--protein transferase [Marinomonas ostreistagni]|uniref:Leucyl/phenylalanyl-tRNA--protein transferase n=1 Tax=Marinomonas ostreistagni TaxID=359209 RepID=A0ABS0ZEG1_9GAMM|nr:leucyl/phenylalanyl-tRNA--protein transferase [Marinomonas ostreistagni]MBJ7551301.1 leucyl/phenylalanyl-tRNA--protein transferase [Marinomonas ostreistagni]